MTDPIQRMYRDAFVDLSEASFDETLDNATHDVFDAFYPILDLPAEGEAKTALLYRINDAIGAIMREYKS